MAKNDIGELAKLWASLTPEEKFEAEQHAKLLEEQEKEEKLSHLLDDPLYPELKEKIIAEYESTRSKELEKAVMTLDKNIQILKDALQLDGELDGNHDKPKSTTKVKSASNTDSEFLRGVISQSFWDFLKSKQATSNVEIEEVIEAWRNHPDNNKPGRTYSIKNVLNNLNKNS